MSGDVLLNREIFLLVAKRSQLLRAIDVAHDDLNRVVEQLKVLYERKRILEGEKP